MPTAAAAARTRAGRSAATERTALAADADDEYDREPPSAAAAFVASASAAVLILLVALLAVVLSTAALWTLASAVPTAHASADVRGVGRPPSTAATDYLHRWHRQQAQRRHEPSSYLLTRDQLRRRADDADATRRKRQSLLFKKSREPGVVALTFSLIGGTVSDVRQAFRNVSSIVRETINEASRPATTTSATGDGDPMMMAAGSAVENEIGGSTTFAPIDEKQTGTVFGKLLGRNYRGLRRLFNSELRSALKNSPGNVRDFAVELIGSVGQSLRPSNLLTRGPTGGNSTSTEAATTAT